MSLLATVVTLLLLGLAAATPVGAQGARGTTVPTAGGEVTVFADSLEEIGPDDLESWLASSHALVAAKLTRTVKRELGLAGG